MFKITLHQSLIDQYFPFLNSDWFDVSVTTACVVLLSTYIALKILNHFCYDILKSCLGYRKLLRRMKRYLEKEYPAEYWEDEDFCTSYMKCYEEFRYLRNVAQRKAHGGHKKGWEEFENVKPNSPPIH